MFHRIKIYTVHIRPDEPLAERMPVFIREGFNIWAFIFTGVWALYHRLWAPMLAIVAFNIILGALMSNHVLSANGVIAVQIGFNLLVGFQANDWLRAQLTRRGYILADVAAADSLLRAQQRYFERTLAAA